VAILLAYPVLQFVVTWCFINIGSILMAFETRNAAGEITSFGFYQFGYVLKTFFTSTANDTGISWMNNQLVILINSLGYGLITIFISLPLSLLFSYFLQKNMPLANVFRVIFFLPNIIPIVALVMAFNMPLDAVYGYFSPILKALGMSEDIYQTWPVSQLFIYIYCIWAGLGYNVVLMSGAIGRIPKELYESAELDGAGYFVEFTKITIPLIWPTIVTLVVLGMTNVLTLYLQPYLLTNGTGSGLTYSLAMDIFISTASGQQSAYCTAAAEGLLFSVIWAPIVLLVRNRMSKKYDGIDF
jgi:ABC-type sugar transport system permease subunit